MRRAVVVPLVVWSLTVWSCSDAGDTAKGGDAGGRPSMDASADSGPADDSSTGEGGGANKDAGGGANKDAGSDDDARAYSGDAGTVPDADGDGLSDADEAALGTDPEAADSDGDGLSDGDEVAAGTDPLDPDSDDDGFTDAEEVFLGTDPTRDNPIGEGCAGFEAAASMNSRPVDIIVIVDNSSSMDGEIVATQDRINQDFAGILDAAGVDWRVIMLSRHGAIGHDVNRCDDNGICVQGPLVGTTSCDPLAAPAESERYKQYSVCIDSEDGLAKAAASFDMSPPDFAPGFQPSQYFDARGVAQPTGAAPAGWSSWLRPGALRTFLLISDDKSQVSDAAFVAWMYSKDASFFGTVERPNWVFHSIIAVEAKANRTQPWTADEPIRDADCGPGSAEIGYDYQKLSIQSGGLRFPICENDTFDAVFQAVAETVVESSRVPCVLTPRLTKGSGIVDYERVQVVYESGAGTRTALTRGSGSAACDPAQYFLDDTQSIALCPLLCAQVERDPGARVRLRVACQPVCGDGVVEGDEECDDGNLQSGDTCGPNCTVEDLCGNGSRDDEEECDDGNREDGDGCSLNCRIETGCGDGKVTPPEECDDDNLDDGDGCSGSCEVETGCGDGKLQAGEQCDDGNLTPGDGCDSACEVELI